MSVAQNLAAIREKLGGARLVAVSKNHGVEKIEQALAAGQRIFGESRVQEAAAKFPPLRARYPDIELHLVGALQTNKARAAVELFDVIETVDREKLADALAEAVAATGRSPRFYIEVNSAAEPQKAGILPDALSALLRHCRARKLAVEGLMCIPPRGRDPRPYFTEMKRLAAAHGLPRLSMGMSADYEAALACGATEIRVGTAIFGER